MENRANRFPCEARRVEHNPVFQTRRKAFLELFHHRMHAIGSFDGIGAGQLENAQRGVRLSVEFAVHAVIARRQLHPGHIPHMRDLPICPALDHDVTKLRFIDQPALGIDR